MLRTKRALIQGAAFRLQRIVDVLKSRDTRHETSRRRRSCVLHLLDQRKQYFIRRGRSGEVGDNTVIDQDER